MATSGHNGERPEQGDSSRPEVHTGRKVNAFIGEGVEFRGHLRYDGTIRIDGVLEGEVHAEACLIGEGAAVTAKIRAGTVVCRGRMRGDITAREKIELRAPAVLTGSLAAPTLSIEEGVRFNGEVTMSNNTEPSRLDSRREEEEPKTFPSLAPIVSYDSD